MPAAINTNPLVVLTIGDGSTVLNLIDNVNYCLVDNSWLPAMASMRRSTLGNQGIFDDVVEDFEVYCMGATTAIVRTNVEALANMMNQAFKYWRGDNDVLPVVLTIQGRVGITIQGNTMAALITGPVGNSLENTGNWNVLANSNRARVRLRFTRRGAFMAGTQNWTSSAITSPGEISFGYSSGQYWRSKVTITGFNTGGAAETLPQGYIIISDSRIAAIEAESGGVGISHTDPGAIVTAGASGGNVWRVYNDQINMYDIPAAVLAAGQRYAVFGLMRRGEADSNAWNVRVGAVPSLVTTAADILQADYAASTIIPPTTTNAWYSLGSFTNNNGNKMLVNYQTNDPTYLAQTMLIDMFVIVAIDRPSTNIVLIEKQTLPLGSNCSMIIDHGTFERSPSIQFTDGTRTAAARWRGNLISESKGPLFFRYLACNNNAASGIRLNGAAIALTIAAQQSQLYLGPR